MKVISLFLSHRVMSISSCSVSNHLSWKSMQNWRRSCEKSKLLTLLSLWKLLILFRLSSCSTAKVFSSTFYLPSRMGAVYLRLSLKGKIPRFATLEDWEKRKSTKVDICSKICLHILSRDDAPMMEFKDGQVFFPKVPPPAPGESVSRLDKILIYLDFASFGPLLCNVCAALVSLLPGYSICIGPQSV